MTVCVVCGERHGGPHFRNKWRNAHALTSLARRSIKEEEATWQ